MSGEDLEPASSEECYSCGYAYANLRGLFERSGKAPAEGDLALCPSCGAVGIFTGIGMAARTPSPLEVREILSDPDVLQRVSEIERARRAAVALGRERERVARLVRAARWN